MPATLVKVALLYECFSRFLNCKNGTKLYKASHMLFTTFLDFLCQYEKHPSIGVLIKKVLTKKVKEIHRRRPTPKCDFNKAALRFY